MNTDKHSLIRGSVSICVYLWLVSLPAFAAVDGTVVNRTTGKPQANAVVSLVQPGPGGMQTLASAKTGAEGKFKFDQDVQGPRLIQALYEGVLYNKILMQGVPSSGLEVDVYNSSNKSEIAKVSQHFIVLQPSDTELRVNEGILYQGDPKLTFNDPGNGTLHFYLPPAAQGTARVTINTSGGMPIQRPAEKTSQANVYKVSYPIKPGETRFDVSYTLPLENPLVFSGRILHVEGVSDLVAPNGVTLKGENIEAVGQEPRTQATLYRIKGASYKVEVQGTGSLPPPAAASASDDESGMPSIEQVHPRIYDKMYWILGIAFTILGLGSFLLYRRSAS